MLITAATQDLSTQLHTGVTEHRCHITRGPQLLPAPHRNVPLHPAGSSRAAPAGEEAGHQEAAPGPRPRGGHQQGED